MRNIMEFEGGYRAAISYDPETDMFRGEFIGLNGGADFYARDIDGMKKEGKISLDMFLKMCEDDGVPPRKSTGNFALRMAPELYDTATATAHDKGMSLNAFICQAVRKAVKEY